MHDLELLTIQDNFDWVQQSNSIVKTEVATIRPHTFVWEKKV